MPRYLILLAVPLCLVALAGFRVLSFRRLKALSWPSRLGYYGFKRRVIRYLRQAGWAVDTNTWVPIDLLAQKGAKKLAVICLPSDIDLTTSRVRDLASIPSRIARNRPVVCITMDDVAQHHVDDAAANNVTLIWYKHMASL